MPGVTVDGNDVLAVRDAAATAVDLARAGGGPTLLEALTYRFVGHSRSDPGAYRPDGELDRWRKRDPITVLAAQLVSEGVDEARLDELRLEVADQLERMREQGLAAPWPTALQAREFKG